MAQTIKKKITTPIVSIYSVQSGKPWSKVEKILHYDGKPYIPETLQADLLERNHDDPLAGYFGVEKTLEFFTQKYYWPKMRTDIERYV